MNEVAITGGPAGDESSSALRELFLSVGEKRSAEGHEPFLIDDRRFAYFVESGPMHVFSVGVDDGAPSGARDHLASFDNGSVLFGMQTPSGCLGHGFMATGVTNSTVIVAPLATVLERVRSGEAKEEFAAVADSWIATISEAAAPPERTKASVLASFDEKVVVEERGVISTKKDVVWLGVRSEELAFLGTEELYFPDDELNVFPAAPGSWLETLGAGEFETFATPVLVRNGMFEDGLVNFHTAVVTSVVQAKLLKKVDINEQQKTKAANQERAREDAGALIVSVMEPEWRDLAGARGEGGDDPLLTACSLVGKKMGLAVKPHPSPKPDATQHEQLLAISKASRFRVRDIALRDEWWDMDNGPFLAFLDDDDTPCAIIPTSPTSSRCINGRTHESVPVTEKVADILHPIGKAFYRPFPDGKLTKLALIKYGIYGLQKEFVTVLLMGIGLGLLGMMIPYFTKEIFETVIPQASKGQLRDMVGGMAAVAFGVAAFEITRAIAVVRVESRMDYSIQSALWDRLLSLPLSFFRNYTAGDLADRAFGIDKIRELVSGAGVSSVLGSFTAVFYVIQMFQFDIRLAMAGIGLAFIAALFTSVMNLWQLSHQRKLYAVVGKVTSVIFQFISGVAKIRVAGAEDHAYRVWAEWFTNQRQISWIVGRISNIVHVFTTTFPVFSSLVLFYFLSASQEAARAEGMPGITTGDFIAFNAAYGLFLAAVLQLSGASLQIFQVIPVFERFKPILVTEPEIDEAKGYPGTLTGDIELHNISFRYDADGPLILRNLSMKINSGQFVAFVGPSGSGKSTVLRLLLGFEKAESGKIYFDGQDLDSLDIREVRQQIGVVLQTSRLMPTDIYRNIIGNNTSLSMDDAMEAAAMAGLDEDIKKMPMKMHTVVSEGGGAFSGGQKQRLMIARAVVTRPPMIFLDEATSALDNRSQAIVTASLDRMQATRIAVAHRLSTIKNADCIYVLVKGQVAEHGNFDELMALDGHFAELAKRQIV